MRKKLATLITAVIITTTALTGCGSSSSSNKTTESDESSAAISVISREDGSGTRGAFTELMGIIDENKNDLTIDTAEITNSTSVMITTVAGNKDALGYISLGSLSDDVKALKVDGVEATAENVKSGTYKVSRPFLIAYKDGSLSDIAKDFIKYIMSPDGQKVVGDEGYISVKEGDAYKASGLKGTVTFAGSTSVAPLMGVLADDYKKLNPNVTIEIQESGSSAGIQSAIEGAAEVAMSSRELEGDEGKSLISQQIAMDGIAVIVNKENTVANITSDQIKKIYTGEMTNWSEVK